MDGRETETWSGKKSDTQANSWKERKRERMRERKKNIKEFFILSMLCNYNITMQIILKLVFDFIKCYTAKQKRLLFTICNVLIIIIIIIHLDKLVLSQLFFEGIELKYWN